MAKKKEKEKKETPFLMHVLKTPYYIAKGVYIMTKKAEEGEKKRKIERKRKAMIANYEGIEIVDTKSGDYKKWEEDMMEAESKIGIILGARGSGKSA